MASLGFQRANNFLLEGTTQVRGKVAADGRNGAVDAAGIAHAAANFQAPIVLAASRALDLPHGGLVFVNSVGANRTFNIGEPGNPGRRIKAVLTYETALANFAVFSSTAGNFRGGLIRRTTAVLTVTAGHSSIGFNGGSAGARANPGDWIEFVDTGTRWMVSGVTQGTAGFYAA